MLWTLYVPGKRKPARAAGKLQTNYLPFFVYAMWGIMMSPNKFVRAVFPGSFDPITNGHLDVIKRGVKIFDELIIAVGDNPDKAPPLFSADERVAMIQEVVKDIPYIRVEKFAGLTVDYVKKVHAQVLLRGMRNLTDVQY